MEMVSEARKPRMGRPPSGLPHKPNVNAQLHDRVWSALIEYGDGNASRGLECAVERVCELVQAQKLGSAPTAALNQAASEIAPRAHLVRAVLPAPPPVAWKAPEGVGRPPRRDAKYRRRHNFTLYGVVRAQLVIFGDGSFASGVERSAHLLGLVRQHG